MKRQRTPSRLPTLGLIVAALVIVVGAGWWMGHESAPDDTDAAAAPATPGARLTAAANESSDEFLSGAVTLTVREDTEIRDFPSLSGGAVLRQQATGTSVTGRWVRGADPNSRWLRLMGGGYVHGAALNTADVGVPEPVGPPPGEAIRIAISNTGCTWGSAIQPYFDQAIAQRERLFPDGSAPEDASSYVRVPRRNWQGLTVTAVAIHWETSSIYFAEPLADVRRAFAAAGIEVAADGLIPIRNEEAVESQSIYTTSGEGARYGATVITCGV